MINSQSNTGLMIIISGPSGTGKSTIINKLLEEENFKFSISHATRKPRGGEVNGKDYYFIDIETFNKMIEKEEFVEWAVVHSNLYGTSKSEIERLKSSGNNIVFEVDYQGGLNLMKLFPDAISIFLLPKSITVLKERLEGRRTDSFKAIELRLLNAKKEIEAAKFYNYIVINDKIDEALNDIKAIIKAEKLKISRNLYLIQNLL